MKTYTTISGDTFDSIAKDQLGDELLAGIIIEANIQNVDVLIFGSGVVLSIPDVTEEVNQDLPPWKSDGR